MTKIAIYVCDYCEFSTPNRKQIRSHVRKKHRIRGAGRLEKHSLMRGKSNISSAYSTEYKTC